MRCAALEALRGVAHGFSTRQAPGNVGGDPAAEPPFVGRREGFLRACGLDPGRLVFFRQVHGAGVIDLGVSPPPSRLARADAAVAVGGAALPGVRWADCVPLLLADEGGLAVAAVHAGWRGTVAGVVRATLATLSAHGVDAGRLTAALGPAIGGCCYEVGDDVAAALAAAAGVEPRVLAGRAAGRWRLDLRRAVRLQLLGAGLAPERIHVAPWCTACAPELFFSFRREGAAAGRQMACIGCVAGRAA